jgi:hypothetical protein
MILIGAEGDGKEIGVLWIPRDTGNLFVCLVTWSVGESPKLDHLLIILSPHSLVIIIITILVILLLRLVLLHHSLHDLKLSLEGL